MKRKPTPGTVLVVNAIHDPQKRVYTYDTREVSEDTANDQLSKAEMERNIHWRGVRYATKEEYNEYYGIKESAKVEEVTSDEPAAEEGRTRRGRKPREEVVNE